MSTSSVPSFPHDLIDAQRALHAVRHEHAAFLATLPTWAEASALPEAASWSPGDPPVGRSTQQAEQEAELRERQLALQVQAHPFWSTLEGPALVNARSALPSASRE